MGPQIWTGDGSACVFLSVAYLSSRARWEADKKQYSHSCFAALEQDLRARGEISALLVVTLILQAKIATYCKDGTKVVLGSTLL